MQACLENLDSLACKLEGSLSRAEALDRRMRTRLADSLSHIGDACIGHVSFDRDLHQSVIDRIRSCTVPAQTFAAYGELVLALDENDLSAAANLFSDLAALVAAPQKFGVFRFRAPAECAISRRYLRWMDTNSKQSFRVLPITDDEAAAFADMLVEAWRLLDQGSPELAAETRHLAREIIVARGDRDPKAITFDGASSFLLWGAILLNSDTPKTPLDLVQALIHESGHNLLFGFCAHGPLVDNEDDELFDSPLRTDLRPMDGVVHATYVTARMNMGVRQLLQSGILASVQRAEAERALAGHERAFASGLEVVERHGQLTPLGGAAIAAAKDHMLLAAN